MALSANSWQAERDGDIRMLNVMSGMVLLLLSSDLLQCDRRICDQLLLPASEGRSGVVRSWKHTCFLIQLILVSDQILPLPFYN